MSEKFTALQLADALSLTFPGNLGVDKAAVELRRLSVVNAELLETVRTLLPIAARVIQGTTDGEPLLKQARAAIARAEE
jgi:hypothetical protein